MTTESNDSPALGVTVDVREPELESVPPSAGEPQENASGLGKRVIRRNMLFCILLDTIWMTGWQDFQLALTPLLVYLNAPNKIIGLVLGAVWITLPGMLISPWITRRFPIKKWYLFGVNIPYVGAIGFAGLAVIFSKHLGISNATLLIVVVASVAAHKFFEGFVALPHQEYVAGCIPASHRGRYAGLSLSLGSLVSVGSTAIGGVILYKLSKPMSFGYLFVMTWIICQSGYWFALMAKEKPSPVEASPKPWSKAMLSAVWQNKPYVRFLIVWTLPTITWYAAQSYMMVYGLDELHMPAYTVATVGVIALVTRSVGAAPSGMLVDRLGSKKILPIWPLANAGMYALLILWPSPWAIYIGTIINVLIGTVVNTAMVVLAYGLPRPEHRAGHYTVQFIVQNMTAAAGVMTTGVLLDVVTFRTAFIASAVLALLYYPFLRWMIKPLSGRVTDYS